MPILPDGKGNTMQMRQMGNSGIEASAIAMGAWAIGGGSWWGDNDDALSIHAIHAALDAGVNLIDTAPGYGLGHSEEVVGRAIKGRRDQVVIATKCGLWWGSTDRGAYYFDRDGRTVYKTLQPDSIREEVEISLRRLGTDYIDLYQTHWPSLVPDAEPIAATMECLMDLKRQGKIRAIGASNVNLEQVREYQVYGVLDAVQLRYSMLDRLIEGPLLDYCREQNIAVLAHSPLEHGLLTGKIGMDREFSPDELRGGKIWFTPANRGRVLQVLAGWSDLTAKYGCDLAQLVIAWTISQPGMTYTLCGARKPDQVRDNVGATRLVLDAADMQRMRRDVEALGDPQPA